jgi:ABC-2 type transport system ATP-binding protein
VADASGLPPQDGDDAGDGGGAVIVARDLTKTFRTGGRTVSALDGVGFEAGGGRITGLIGPDGAGKTTLMRIACGLLRPDEGHVLAEPLRVQAEVRYMPQRFGLYEDLSVRENLDLYADLQGLATDAREERYGELMHMSGLAPFMARLAGRLSGGMKQKLGLACALLRPPRLLLLDEPTVGVDPVSRRELWSIVDALVRERGMSVLLSTAYLDEAERCADVVLLHEGRVLGQGPPQRFSEPMRGRTFVVMQGDRVRLVTDEEATGDPATLLPDAALHAEAVPPRFEDGFVARVKARRAAAASAPRTSEALEVVSRPAGDETVIRAEALDRRFGDFYAVRGLDFDVRRGEIFGLLGANGAGKSTTFRMLCGLLPPTGGRLEVVGVDLRRAPARARARIGYMAQRFSLYGSLTVAQNLSFFASAYGLSGRRRRERAGWALEQFELTPFADTDSQTLPLGFKQRLAMAAALLHDPEVLFLDEPTSGVDPLARREFWRRINALAEAGVTVLVTTHFMEEAEYCDRLAIMAAGRILTLGTPPEVKARTGDERGPASSMEEAFVRLVESDAKAA